VTKINSKAYRFFRASFVGGLFPAILAPMLWPIVVLLIEGNLVSFSGLFYVLGIALIVGLSLALAIGFPMLLMLDYFHVNNTATAGVMFSLLAFFLFVYPPVEGIGGLIERWPLVGFFSLLGGSAGAIASYLSRRECPLQRRGLLLCIANKQGIPQITVTPYHFHYFYPGRVHTMHRLHGG